MAILVLTTGGTIGGLPYPDPEHPPVDAAMPSPGQDLVREALAAFPHVRCISLEPRDSKLIDAEYRDNLRALIVQAPETAVLVTHGTDTILQTADFFYLQPVPGKKIILTGAMTPLANGPQSDGYLNLRFALDQFSRADLVPVSIVLCDFDVAGQWQPRLYPYAPGRYEKFYAEDGRYNRLETYSHNPHCRL
jgi:L-asparaginase